MREVRQDHNYRVREGDLIGRVGHARAVFDNGDVELQFGNALRARLPARILLHDCYCDAMDNIRRNEVL